MSAVYHSVCERVDFSIRFDTLWHSCGISTRQWKGYKLSITPGAGVFTCPPVEMLAVIFPEYLQLFSLETKSLVRENSWLTGAY